MKKTKNGNPKKAGIHSNLDADEMLDDGNGIGTGTGSSSGSGTGTGSGKSKSTSTRTGTIAKAKTDGQSGGSTELSLKNELIAIVFLFLSILLIFSLISYSPSDLSYFNSTPEKTVANYAGRVGSELSALFFNLFGFASYVLVIYMLLVTSYYLLNKRIKNMITKSSGYLLLLFAAAAFISNLKPIAHISGREIKSGGITGYFANEFFLAQLKPVFTFLFFLLLIIISLVLIAKLSLRRIIKFLFKMFLKLCAFLHEYAGIQMEKYKKYRNIKKLEAKYNTTYAAGKKNTPIVDDHRKEKEKGVFFKKIAALFQQLKERRKAKEKYPQLQPEPDVFTAGTPRTAANQPIPATSPGVSRGSSLFGSHELQSSPSARSRQPLQPQQSPQSAQAAHGLPGTPTPYTFGDRALRKEAELSRSEQKRIIREPSKLPEEAFLFSEMEEESPGFANYHTPPLTYLDAPTEHSKVDFKELENKKEELSQRLTEFRIRGEIVEYTPGPVITTYEFVPDTGVKVKDVTNLSEDLALVAKAQYVRIERILGKKAIGIEIPNKKRELITLREILESDEYKNSTSPLTFAVGKTKSGEIFISDLRDMPHLIIAGATGSGKSVAIHSLILSILYRATPDEVKLVLIDPKRVELSIYSRLPHLLTPVVIDMKLAKNALDWSVFEMEKRYKKLAVLQVRSIDQYNRKLELLLQSEDELLDKLEDKERMPYIVIVIDEFADLMMECSKDIEQAVARIAQKARAVGIHLILATQRPSIDVITGTIKNNFPSRIALAVPSKHDSRTIIDVMGAEKLLGNGDMLFLPPKTASLIRLHGAFVSEGETMRVVNYLAKIAKPRFNTQVLKPVAKEGDGEFSDQDLDAMFFDAAEIVITSGQASASFLQRKMSIGYARAGRLIDQLQKNGVVSASDSQNKREVLMSLSELDELQGRGNKAEQL